MDSETPPAHLKTILRTLSHATVTIFSQDRDLRYRWIENPPPAWRAGDIAGKTDADVLPPAAAALAATVKREALSTGRASWTDVIVERGGVSRFFDIFVEPEKDSHGEVIGVIGLAVDVTDRRKQAATLEAVARDISHRSKNLLAIIQSLATQTALSASSTEDFIDQFRGRIQSISRSQDLPIGAKRHGARLASLVRTQVEPYLADGGKRVAFTGSDCELSPNATLHVGLALFELCMGAARFGALSTPGGTVAVKAEVLTGGNGARSLRVTWEEANGPSAPEADGFGRVLLQRVVPASVGGVATMVPTVDGRRYQLTLSAEEFEATG